MKPMLQGLASVEPGLKAKVDPPLGSAGAMRALLAGALDLAVISRPVRPEEAGQGATAREYGRTPLLVVTHAAVKRRDVTVGELVEIFEGRLATWEDGERIRLVLRPEGDADTRLLTSLSPALRRADAAARRQPWALIAVTDPEASQLVATTPGGLGAASLTSLIVEGKPLHALTLEGVEGTLETLASGRYPLGKTVIFVTTPRSPAGAQAIVDFAFSAKGRAIAAQAGVLVRGADGDR
jgi:phosphate transport system substrate-binding protein